jgi:glycosyltransferase involved in cell wall biosynthesis
MANLSSEEVNTNIKVSVIIPTYNRARFIKDAIESVLDQTYKNFEIIVIDDGSTDNTLEILTQYARKIKVLKQDHRGVAAARNKGISVAKGEYLAFLDSDDIWYPLKLEKQLKVMEQTKAGLVHTARYEVDVVTNKRSALLPLLPAKSSKEFLSGKTHISMTVLVAKELVVREGLFDENLQTTQDTDLWVRIAKIADIVYINEPLMDFRMAGDNLQKKMGLKYKNRIVVYQKALKDPDKRILKPIWKIKLAVNYYLFAKERYKNQYFKESLNFVLKALTLNLFVGCQNMTTSMGWIAIDNQHGLTTRIKLFFNPYILLVKSLIKKSLASLQN